MGEETALSLEQALAETEVDIEAALKAATGVVSTLKKLRKAAQLGNLRDMQTALNNSEQGINRLVEAFDQAKTGWDFDEETYFATDSFFTEIRGTAAQNDLRIFEQDDRLFCYPVLVRALPGDRAVMIDKRRERRLRPTVLTGVHGRSLPGPARCCDQRIEANRRRAVQSVRFDAPTKARQ